MFPIVLLSDCEFSENRNLVECDIKEASDKYLLKEGLPFLHSKELRPEDEPMKWLSVV